MAKCLYCGYWTSGAFRGGGGGGILKMKFLRQVLVSFVSRDLIDFDIVFIGFYYGLVALQIYTEQIVYVKDRLKELVALPDL